MSVVAHLLELLPADHYFNLTPISGGGHRTQRSAANLKRSGRIVRQQRLIKFFRSKAASFLCRLAALFLFELLKIASTLHLRPSHLARDCVFAA